MVTRLEYIRTEIVTVVEFTYSLEEPCVLLQVSDEISIISVSYLRTEIIRFLKRGYASSPKVVAKNKVEKIIGI